MKTFLSTLLCLISIVYANGQTPMWAFNIGSPQNDEGRTIKVAPNGNVCVAGKFMGTMDLNPGPGVNNVTSNGFDDIYLACYSPTGVFLWGFNLGGNRYDATWYMTIDAGNNVYICGYFQSAGIDFDPGAGVTTLPFAGGTSLTYYGDGFVAKYTSTGNFQWAKALGGTTVYDITLSLDTDPAGNLYVGGVFNTSMVVTPSITLTSITDGTAYLIKYDAAGNVIWAHNYGLPGIPSVDCFPRSLKVSAGFIYVAGFFQGTSNFNPWGSPATLTATGTYDFYVAKYDVNGNFVFVKQVIGTGGTVDEFLSLSLDAADNIYVLGITNSGAITFNPAATTTTTMPAPGGGSNNDIILAKFTSTGTYLWGKVIGGTGSDIGFSIDVSGSNVFCTGQFSNTVNFAPGGTGGTLTSAGLNDIFVSQYDLNGNFLCNFRVGAPATNDGGFGITHDASGNILITGQFGGTAIDFDPTAGTYPLTSIGSTDAFVAKYRYDSAITGNFAGDTICAGTTAYLTVNITSGPAGPYTITFTNGITTFTVTGIMSGVPFAVIPSPISLTGYTVVSATYTGSGFCSPPTVTISNVATVQILPLPGPITGNAPLCIGNTIALSNTFPGGTWSITPSSVATISASGIVTGVSTGTATVSYTNNCGPVTVVVTVNVPPITDNTSICMGDSKTLSNPAAGGTWSCSPASVASISPGGVITTISPGTATVYYTTLCGTATAIITINALRAADAGPDKWLCEGQVVTVTAIGTSATETYLWSTGNTGTSISVNAAGIYWLDVTRDGCKARDSVQVVLKPTPQINFGNDTLICKDVSTTIGTIPEPFTTYMWNTGSTSPSIVISTDGTYILTATRDGCSTTRTKKVSAIVPPAPFSLGPDTVLCKGDVYTLRTVLENATWNEDGSNGASHTVSNTGTYWATVQNECGMVQDSVTVRFDACNIWFPNAFTPNNDGKNDLARVRGNLGYYTDFSLSIYNRWGERVYYTEDIYSGWNGIFKGVEQELGVYFYMIFYTLHGQKSMLKGDITLIR